MKLYLAILTLLLIAGIGAAYDQRDGSNGVPYLAPDPSLKTTDPFYLGTNAAPVNIIPLPPIFGGPMPAPEIPWMQQDTRGKNMSLNVTRITAASSYDLTETQMVRANITNGQESWL